MVTYEIGIKINKEYKHLKEKQDKIVQNIKQTLLIELNKGTKGLKIKKEGNKIYVEDPYSQIGLSVITNILKNYLKHHYEGVKVNIDVKDTRKQKIKELENVVKEREIKISELSKRIKQLEEGINKREEDNEKLTIKILDHEKEIKELKGIITEYEKKYNQKCEEYEKLKKEYDQVQKTTQQPKQEVKAAKLLRVLEKEGILKEIEEIRRGYTDLKRIEETLKDVEDKNIKSELEKIVQESRAKEEERIKNIGTKIVMVLIEHIYGRDNKKYETRKKQISTEKIIGLLEINREYSLADIERILEKEGVKLKKNTLIQHMHIAKKKGWVISPERGKYKVIKKM